VVEVFNYGKEKKMTKRKTLVVLLGFALATLAAAKSNREIFNSWVGHHYTKLGAKIPGRPSYSGNSVTYDSTWTETRAQSRPPSIGTADIVHGRGLITTGKVEPGRIEYYTVTHERWVTFYFDSKGMITTWRSYGWPMD
jgi:hypothetical protein